MTDTLLELFLSLRPDEEIVVTRPELQLARVRFVVIRHTPAGKIGCTAEITKTEIEARAAGLVSDAPLMVETALIAVRRKIGERPPYG